MISTKARGTGNLTSPVIHDDALADPSKKIADPTACSSSSRIDFVDALRGFAVLGILIMNIQSFAMPDQAYLNPMAFGIDGSIGASANGWAYIFTHLFADQKFITIFSLLFGFSMALMFATRLQHPYWFLGKRNTLLLVIGLLHAYLIWHGDILVSYAICGFLVLGLLRLSPATLIRTGCLLISVPVLYIVFGMMLLPYWDASELAELQEFWQPDAATINSQISQLSGSWSQQFSLRIERSLEMQLYVLPVETVWRVSGLMLLGAALYRLRWLQTAYSRKKILFLSALTLIAGYTVIAIGLVQNQTHQWQASYSMFAGYLYNYCGSLLVGFSYVGLFYVGFQVIAKSKVMRCLQLIGRTALSNYLLQSLFCTWLFYGYGLGWFGHVDRVAQLMLLPVIWSLQILLTAAWLRFYSAGPAEWLWRSALEGRLRPLRRQPDFRGIR